MNTIPPADRSIGFGRHALAVLSASLAAAVLFALFAAGLAWFHKGGIAVPVTIAVIVWLGTFIITLPAAGIVYTIAWPFTRHGGSNGGPVSTVLGAVGGFGLMWTNHAAAGKDSSAVELAMAALIGAIVGTIYWGIARGKVPPEAP